MYIHIGLLLLHTCSPIPRYSVQQKAGEEPGNEASVRARSLLFVHGHRSVVVYIYVGLLFVVTRCCCCPKLLVVTQRYSWSFRICWTLSCTK